ncbi:TonB-dependent receptor [Niveispirillum sp. KHB5.9]|uniref:TonB-dependent receptor n=1 Tax=Niveispirillum sp. KHB5.9 TaxID=3400269 RepID=UPI003A8B90FF
MPVIKNSRRAMLAGAAIAFLAPVAAFAQTAPEAEGFTLEEIIVTATRRAESLQTVPVAVSVVDGDYVQRNNLNNIRDIANIVPTLNFRTAASNKDQALFIRGLGTVSTSPGVEPTISTVIDGVVLARQGQATLDLLDIERIEVLRGPQGTLFGKNASGGVVNIVGRAPTEDFKAYVDAGWFGGGNERRLRAGVSGALSPDKARASLTALWGRYDGNVTNVFNGRTVNGYERAGARAKLELLPTDDLRVMLIADFMHATATPPQGVVTRTFLTAYPTNNVTNFPAFAAALGPVVASADNREINSNYDTRVRDDNGGLSAQIDWRIGDHDLTAISAWRRWENTQFQDQDRLPRALAGLPQQHDRGDLRFDQYSQEIRLASPKGNLVDYIVGLYYMRAENEERYRRDTTVVSAAGSTVHTGIADYGVTNDNYSVFGEATVNMADDLRAIAGFRLVKDDLRYDFKRVSTSPVPVPGIQVGFTSSGSTTPTDYANRLGLQYDLSDTAMTYATWSRGYKGPAYNIAFSMLPQDTGALKGETSNAYEAGLKSRFLDGRLQVNLAAFLSRFKDYQVNFFDTYNGSPVTRLINAGRVSTRGIEADLSARPIANLTLAAVAARIEARIDQFTCPAGTAASCQVNGRPLPFSPDWKTDLRANYTIPLDGGWTVDLATNYSWQSKVQYSINQTPDTVQPAFGLWNASIGFESGEGLRVTLLARNIADTHYSTQLNTFGSGVVRFVPRDDRRYFGANIRQEF